jgi:hypothetical protein
MTMPHSCPPVPARRRLFALATPLVVLMGLAVLLLAPNLVMHWTGDPNNVPSAVTVLDPFADQPNH